MELRVSFRGKALVVQGVGGATSIADLKEKLADVTAVPTDNQKLVSYVYDSSTYSSSINSVPGTFLNLPCTYQVLVVI